jgi:hypothetical protein
LQFALLVLKKTAFNFGYASPAQKAIQSGCLPFTDSGRTRQPELWAAAVNWTQNALAAEVTVPDLSSPDRIQESFCLPDRMNGPPVSSGLSEPPPCERRSWFSRAGMNQKCDPRQLKQSTQPISPGAPAD